MVAMVTALVMARLGMLIVSMGLDDAAMAVFECRHFRSAEAITDIRSAPAHRLGGEQQDHQDRAEDSVSALAHGTGELCLSNSNLSI